MRTVFAVAFVIGILVVLASLPAEVLASSRITTPPSGRSQSLPRLNFRSTTR